MLDRLASFFVFDSHFNLSDESPGDIIYFYSDDNELNQSVNRRFIFTGVCTAIIDLCQVFNRGSSYCDYLVTNDREMSLLPIGDDLYFFLSLKSKAKTSNKMDLLEPSPTHSRKTILQNALIMIQKILFLNVERPKRETKSGKFPENFKTDIQYYVPIILKIFDWNDLSITNLWTTSYYLLNLPKNYNMLFQKELEKIQEEKMYLKGLILTYNNQTVATTVESELTSIINFLVSKKYPIFFPTAVKEKENRLQWTIGVNEDSQSGFFSRLFSGSKKAKSSFTSVLIPPLFWKEKVFALAALKYNSASMIFILDPEQMDVNKDFGVLKNLVAPILDKCSSFSKENNKEYLDFIDDLDNRFKESAGAKLFYNYETGKLQFVTNRILNSDAEIVKNAIVFANEANVFIKSELMKEPLNGAGAVGSGNDKESKSQSSSSKQNLNINDSNETNFNSNVTLNSNETNSNSNVTLDSDETNSNSNVTLNSNETNSNSNVTLNSNETNSNSNEANSNSNEINSNNNETNSNSYEDNSNSNNTNSNSNAYNSDSNEFDSNSELNDINDIKQILEDEVPEFRNLNESYEDALYSSDANNDSLLSANFNSNPLPLKEISSFDYIIKQYGTTNPGQMRYNLLKEFEERKKIKARDDGDDENLVIHTKSLIPLDANLALFLEQKDEKFFNFICRKRKIKISETLDTIKNISSKI